jgi:hypothetical protein
MPVKKPLYGEPCNGCGHCCDDQICPLAAAVFSNWRAPCPALEPSGEARVCGLINNPTKYAPVRIAIQGRSELSLASAHLCGAGVGCDAIAAGEVVDFARRQYFQRQARRAARSSAVLAAKRVWGLSR